MLYLNSVTISNLETVLYILINPIGLRFVIDHDTIVSLLVLPFLLESKIVLKTALEVKHFLRDERKDLAKIELQKIMFRDCSKLSEMGINKALSEAVAMRLFINWFAIMVWYILLGLEGAIIMQMVAVMNRSFSFKHKRWEIFGAFIYRFEQALLIPSHSFLCILYIVCSRFHEIQ